MHLMVNICKSSNFRAMWAKKNNVSIYIVMQMSLLCSVEHSTPVDSLRNCFTARYYEGKLKFEIWKSLKPPHLQY